MTLEDRVVVVTGGARGIGRALVEGFLEAGSKVVAIDQSWDGESAFGDEIVKRGGLTLAADVRDDDSIGRAYDDKDAQEMRIRRSGLVWTLVRPGVLTSGAATGRYKVLTEPSAWRNGLISRADVAGYIVGQIDHPSHEGKAVVLVG